MYLTTSPSRTRRLLRVTRFMRMRSSPQVSSVRTIHTVCRRFLPLNTTVSPRKSCSSSVLLWWNTHTHTDLRGNTHMTRIYIYSHTHADLWQADDAAVFIESFVHNQSVGSLFLLQDGSGEIFSLWASRQGTHYDSLTCRPCTNSSDFLMWHWAVFRLSLVQRVATIPVCKYMKKYLINCFELKAIVIS